MADDPLAEVRAAAAQYNAFLDAKELLRNAVVAALRAGHRPTDVEDASTVRREQVRRWAREAGIPPAERGGGRGSRGRRPGPGREKPGEPS